MDTTTATNENSCYRFVSFFLFPNLSYNFGSSLVKKRLVKVCPASQPSDFQFYFLKWLKKHNKFSNSKQINQFSCLKKNAGGKTKLVGLNRKANYFGPKNLELYLKVASDPIFRSPLKEIRPYLSLAKPGLSGLL